MISSLNWLASTSPTKKTLAFAHLGFVSDQQRASEKWNTKMSRFHSRTDAAVDDIYKVYKVLRSENWKITLAGNKWFLLDSKIQTWRIH